MTNPNASPGTESPGPGRPRDRVRHKAVLDATRDLLREGGYSALNIDAIARRADVSRRMIYRWWGHKARIVEETLFRAPVSAEIPDTGSLEGDIRALVDELVTLYARREMVLGLPGLQADLVASPDLLEETEQRYTSVYVQRWHDVLSRAESRGDLEAGRNHRALFSATTGAITVLTQDRIFRRRAELTDFVTDLILRGLR